MKYHLRQKYLLYNVPYKCCVKSSEDYYIHQSGGGLNYYQCAALQKGYGFGGLF